MYSYDTLIYYTKIYLEIEFNVVVVTFAIHGEATATFLVVVITYIIYKSIFCLEGLIGPEAACIWTAKKEINQFYSKWCQKKRWKNHIGFWD